MKKLLTIAIVLAALESSTAQVPAALQAKFQDTLSAMRSRFNFKGLSAAVSYRSKGIWKSAVGVSEDGMALTPDMLIGIGSNTKTFVSVMMIKLKDAGKVSLSDTIGKWVSGYPNINGGVTIRQLLNHTSGINSYTNNTSTWDSVNKDINRLWTKEEILSKFVAAPTFAPGKGWEYSNTNFIIAGLIEEKITGKSMQQLIRDSILTPQSLAHTFFPPYETASDPYAHLWTDWNGDDVLDDVGEYATSTTLPKEINSIADAAGALVSTAEDNVKFWKALMTGSIIGKASIKGDLLQWSGWGTASSDYGLGIFKNRFLGNTVFSHGGTWIGQINENLADTVNDIYITVLSNQDSLQNDEVLQVVLALYRTALDAKLSVQQTALNEHTAIKIFPNPASGMITVRFEDPAQQTAHVFDYSGKLMKEIAVPAGQHESTINVAEWPSGTYILKPGGASYRSVQQFQVMH